MSVLTVPLQINAVCVLDMYRHMAFFAGSMLAVLIILTVVDEDVLTVEHVIAIMTVLGLVTTVCGVLIPNEVAHGPLIGSVEVP